MTIHERNAEQAQIPGTWQNRQGRGLDDGTDEVGVPGTGVVLAVMVTFACFAAGMVAFEVFQVLRRWFA